MKQMKRTTLLILPIVLLAAYGLTRTSSVDSRPPTENRYVTESSKKSSATTAKGKVDSSLQIKPTASVPDLTPNSRREVGLETIRELSDKIFLSARDKEDLKRSLLARSTIEKIQSALYDPSLLQANRFSERIKHLDAVYEGLKFKDSSVQAVYSRIAAKFLISEPPDVVKRDKKLQEQFFGDRVELALMMRTIDIEAAKVVEQNIVSESPKTKAYFKQAEAMANVYQVSL